MRRIDVRILIDVADDAIITGAEIVEQIEAEIKTWEFDRVQLNDARENGVRIEPLNLTPIKPGEQR